jgi:hypothetical protein
MPQLDLSIWVILIPYIICTLSLFYIIFYSQFSAALINEIKKAYVLLGGNFMFIFNQNVFYCLLLIWFISSILAGLLICLSYFFIQPKPYSTKVSAYECGFTPLGEVRISYDIHFYRIAILFLIFYL